MQSRFDTRLKRRELSLTLWLTRVFAVLFFFGGAENLPACEQAWARATLRELGRRLMGVIVSLALREARDEAPVRPKAFDPRAPKHFVVGTRCAFGAALRRALSGKTIAEKFQRLVRGFAARRALAKNWAKRFGRGRTRRLFAHTRAAIGADEFAVAPMRLFQFRADTS